MLSTLLNPFNNYTIPFAQWVQASVDWMTVAFRPAFQAARWPVAHLLDGLQGFFVSIPQSIFLLCLLLVGWQVAGLRTAVLCTLAMAFLGLIGVWQQTMVTLALICSAVVFSVAIGLPVGILVARNDRAEAIVRPVLDVMQTLPAFVYLVPIVMLVGIGNVPGVMITIVFALPPIVRLTNLGIRSVEPSIVEAAYAFGSTSWQVLWKVEMPLAIRAITTGVNQTLMMALAMVTYASMIAVQGLGLLVLRGIGRLDMGLAAIGGIGIVVLAMVIDRLTQAATQSERERRRQARKRPLSVLMEPLRQRPAKN